MSPAPFRFLVAAALVTGCGAEVTPAESAGSAQGGRAATGSSQSGGGGEAAGGGETAGGGGPACANPAPVLQPTGEPSGFVRCDDGVVHRVERVACVQPTPTSDCDQAGGAACERAEDCQDRPLGACVAPAFSAFGCTCEYGCASDDDCDGGEICACAGVVGDRPRCIRSRCATDAQCAGETCAVSARTGSCNEVYAAAGCLERDAECRTDEDCAAAEPFYCGTNPEHPAECELRYLSDTELAWACGEPAACGPCG